MIVYGKAKKKARSQAARSVEGSAQLIQELTAKFPRKQNQPRRTRKEENSDKDSLRTEAEQTAYKNLKEIIPFLKDERGRQKYIQSQRPLCIFRNFLIAESYKG